MSKTSPKSAPKSIKKILAWAASPSKGFNSDSMLDAFLSGVAEVPGVEAEKMYLIDLKIDYYTFANRIPDPTKEPMMTDLAEKVVSVDGIVVATPCFNFNVPAPLKNILDRLSYKALDYKKMNWLQQPTGQLHNLHNFYLVSCGTPWWLLHLVTWSLFPIFWLRAVFWYFGAHSWGGIYGAGLTGKKLARNDVRLMVRCKRAGKKYAQRLVKL